MGKIEINHTGSGSGITLSSDGTDLLLDGSAIGGGGGADLYAAETTSSTNPTAEGLRSIAIGSAANADGYDFAHSNIAIGVNSDALSVMSVALGYNAQAGGQGGMSLGRNSKTTSGTQAVALTQSYASGMNSFAAAIANNTSTYGASGANSIAMGQYAKSTGNNNVAIGKAQALGSDYTIAIGYNAKSTNHSTIAIGREAGLAELGDEAIAIGKGVSAGSKAIALGRTCTATGAFSVAIGNYANTNDIDGKFAFSVDYMNSAGDAQQGKYILHHSTTDATPRAVTSSGSSPNIGNQVNLRNNSAYTFSGTIVGREKASEGTDVGSWEIKGIIRREANAGTTVLVNSVINEIFVPTGWAVAITADTTNGCLKVEVTGVASTNIRWVAIVNTAEVYYP